MLEQSDLLAIAQLMDEKLDNRLESHENRIINQVNAIIETKVVPQIQLIAEQHGDIIARLPDVEEQEALKSRVRVLEHVVTDLRVEMDRLKKAQ